MSLVGARPEVPEYVDLRNPAWQEVLRSRPGITDPVALELRNEEQLIAAQAPDRRDGYYRDVLLPYKLEGYRRYLRARSAATDIRVIFATTIAVIAPRVADSRKLESKVQLPKEGSTDS
jgi:lipopolysaccharide/colanic/teichoic acid biosynthesis glycosyltransferase